MIRLALVNSTRRDDIQSALRAIGLAGRMTAYSASHLEKLKQPALLVFDSDAVEHLTPDLLQSLRRTHTTAIRHSPALVLCMSRGQIKHWRNAGAVAITHGAGAATLLRAVKEAVAGAEDWVTSKGYVGPSRRRRKPVVRLRARRREDAVERIPKGMTLPRVAASLPVLQRRLFLGASLLTGSSVESRHSFRTLSAEVQQAVSEHRRSDLARVAQAIRAEAEAFIEDGQRNSAALEKLVAQLGEKL